jgi:hypothetical protein
MESQRERQASAEIEVTPEMAAAGVKVLKRHISVEYEPVYSYEEIVERIFRTMAESLDVGNFPRDIQS